MIRIYSVPYYYTRSQQQPARKRHETMTEAQMFLDWFNNFPTVDRFASYYGISVSDAKRIIDAGRKQHEESILGAQPEQEETEYDDPALDPDNDFCSCGNLTDNFPVICNHCKWMAGA